MAVFVCAAVAAALAATVKPALGGLVHSTRAVAVTAPSTPSSNWSGYAVTSPTATAVSYTSVTGTWTVPTANCTPADAGASSAVWVGLGGYSETSQELEQTGTSADCDQAGHASYYIWYELVPADSVNLKVKIMPGDVIASSVVVNGTDVLVQVNDRTRHVIFTRHLSMASPDLSSAEWIAEAPSQCSDSGYCPQLSLTRFTPVVFTRSFAKGNNAGGTI